MPQGRSADTSGIGAFKAAMVSIGVLASATMPAPLSTLDKDEMAKIETILCEVGLKE